MGFNFVKFTETDSSFAARVTIRQTGQLGFTMGAINRFKISNYKYCILYFDSDRRVVGMELTDEHSPGSIEVKSTKANTYVRAKNFCDRFAIDYTDSHRYELKLDKESGYLFFELDEEKSDEADDEETVKSDTESDEQGDTGDTTAE